MNDVNAVVEWLTNGVPGAKTPMDVLARMCPGLAAAGVPLDRTEAFVRTLHPHIAGRSFLCVPDKPVQVLERTYGYLLSADFAKSAVGEVFRTAQIVRHRLGGGAQDRPDFAALAADGFTDFFAGPMPFVSGQVNAITFATRAPAGFSEDDVEALTRVLAPLSRVAEIFALLRTAANLLNTYVGHDAGERILAGDIQRGDTSIIRAVIWFSDLRGFTSMSGMLEPATIIRVLNDVFDCQVPSIERHGGEVLKFMGDGMLAIFPCKYDDVKLRCNDALAAVKEAFTALDELNQAYAPTWPAPARFGVALHVGEIAYGNVGGSGRLDFTCIGPAVNLAARLEGLTSKLGARVVVSEAFAKLTSAKLRDLGAFELKGIAGVEKAFAPE
jgi:adenylate cyclase